MSIPRATSRPASDSSSSPTAARCVSPSGPAKSSTLEAHHMPTKLQEHYEATVRPKLMAEFKYKNPMQVPRIDKIVVNMGVGEGTQDAKKVDAALGDLAKITGQRPVKTKSTKSIAHFKLREGVAVGVKVTLRQHVMYQVLDPLIHH